MNWQIFLNNNLNAKAILFLKDKWFKKNRNIFKKIKSNQKNQNQA